MILVGSLAGVVEFENPKIHTFGNVPAIKFPIPWNGKSGGFKNLNSPAIEYPHCKITKPARQFRLEKGKVVIHPIIVGGKDIWKDIPGIEFSKDLNVS